MAPPITPDIEKLIFELYYKKGFLFGRDKLYKKAVELQIPISRRQVADWLNKQEINQLFRQTKPAVKTKPTILSDNNKQIGIDLIDFRNYSYNGYEWILTAIDLFSKKAYAIPMKNKNDITTANAMKKILEQINQPISTIRSDNGSEFVSKQFKKLMKDYNIKQIFSLPNNPQSNGQVERFNGILKTLVRKELGFQSRNILIEDVPKMIKDYEKKNNVEWSKVPRE
jgi:transposase InsO family protein